jgi:hypothetical protein
MEKKKNGKTKTEYYGLFSAKRKVKLIEMTLKRFFWDFWDDVMFLSHFRFKDTGFRYIMDSDDMQLTGKHQTLRK